MVAKARKETFDYDYKFGRPDSFERYNPQDPFSVPLGNSRSLEKPGDVFRLLDKTSAVNLAGPSHINFIADRARSFLSKLSRKFSLA